MAELEVTELRTTLQSAQKDVESKAATIKHLQNALNAKSMTIEILSKHNKEGGDLETVIGGIIEAKSEVLLKAKNVEIASLTAEVEKLKGRSPVGGRASTASFPGFGEEERKRLERELEACRKDLSDSAMRTRRAIEEAVTRREQQLEEESRQALQKERSKLQAAFEEHCSAIASLKEEKDAAKAKANEELAALRSQLEEAQRAASSATQDFAALEAERDALKAKLEATAASDSGANDELERIKKELAEATDRAAVEQRRASETAKEMQEYRMKAFELQEANEAMSSELERWKEECETMQADHQVELEALQKDREVQRKALTEQIDSRVAEVRRRSSTEFEALLNESVEDREKERRRLKELQEEVDTMKLKCDAQQLELTALREALGDDPTAHAEQLEVEEEIAKSPETAPVATGPTSDDPLSETQRSVVDPAKLRRARALREQSEFAFDEMARRIVEVRAECEEEKKRLTLELEQRLKQRGARITELTNAQDSLETQVETLERARDELIAQRDEMSRTARERERALTQAQSDMESASENCKTLQQELAAIRLTYSLQKGVVAPAYSIVRQRLQAFGSPGASPLVADGGEKSESLMDASTIAEEQEGAEEEEDLDDEDDEDENLDNAYGIDEDGQEEWAEMLRANTLNALFTGVGVVVQNARCAAEDLSDQVNNITTSLEYFPQLYAQQLQELDRLRKGKELRSFITILQRAMTRCQRIASAIMELSGRNEDVTGSLQNLIRAKGLEWNLRSLRTAAQHDILLRLQKNQLEKVRSDYEDVLDQYGEECAQTGQLKDRVKDLEKELEEAKAKADAGGSVELEKRCEELSRELAEAKKALEVLTCELQMERAKLKAALSGASPQPSMQGIHQMLSTIEQDTIAEAQAQAEETSATGGKGKSKTKGKAPPLPGAAAEATETVSVSEGGDSPMPKAP
eukprot:CAMPEP_0176034002 /NCGR_PEP_ID=MMETSP0120_2-20121206/16802_1 /TAXON_ID=160619 /ORGANISM="Kryptoperidinium foliaceum, Strain CCMP 1326" /LENGTH=932 /DNA_ID=CAMNT_0017367337 /DNA_START=44 /DNA_END=2838 /DNA_ORIENTATION=-